MDDYETNEEEYNIYPFPSTWDNVYDMDIQTTAPMHTMGPGISKNTMLMTLEFAAGRNKKTTFMRN
eukprot:1770954-Ditylum_brightwellii.AAC.1